MIAGKNPDDDRSFCRCPRHGHHHHRHRSHHSHHQPIYIDRSNDEIKIRKRKKCRSANCSNSYERYYYYRLRIPYLRFNPNSFSIAFLILSIFSSSTIGPYRYSPVLLVSCTPPFRHYNHRLLHDELLHSKSNYSSPSKNNFNIVSYNYNNNNNNNNNNNTNSNTNRNKIDNDRLDMIEEPLRSLSPPPARSRRSFDKPNHNVRLNKTVRETTHNNNHNNSFILGGAGFSRISNGFGRSKSSLIPPCTHLGDDTNDVSARAYVAETIFEGKVRSKSSPREKDGKYGVTFVVQQVFKDQNVPGTLFQQNGLLKPRSQVRLYFKRKPATNVFYTYFQNSSNAINNNNNNNNNITNTNAVSRCIQKYVYAKKSPVVELVKANIKRGRRYIVFVNGVGPHNYTILGEPIAKTKKNTKAIQSVLCKNCVRPIRVSGLNNQSLKIGQQLRLVCRSEGNPLPAIQWFKDGKLILVNSRLRIEYKKKRSSLIVPEVRNNDAGTYECRGIGVQSMSPVQSLAIVNVQSQFENVTALWPLAGISCPTDLVYCLNGGTCTYYNAIGELSCQCAEGFNGNRCEHKDVASNSSTYELITCFDGVTPSYPCVTVHKPLKRINYQNKSH